MQYLCLLVKETALDFSWKILRQTNSSSIVLDGRLMFDPHGPRDFCWGIIHLSEPFTSSKQ